MDRPSAPSRRWLPPLATLALVAVLLTQVDLGELTAALAGMDPRWLAAGVALSLVANIGIFADRWRLTLTGLGIHHELATLLRIHLGAGALRFLLPIQTGEVVNAALLAARGRGSTATHVGAIAYGKYLNLIATLGLGALGFALVEGDEEGLVPRTIAAGAALLALGFLPELPALRRRIEGLATRLGARGGEILVDLLRVYAELGHRRKAALLAYSLLFQLTEVIVCWMLLAGLGIDAGFRQALAVVPVLILASSLPVTLAGVGVREGLGMMLLAAHGTPADLLAFGVLYSAVEYLLPLTIGIPWLPGVLRELAPARAGDTSGPPR